MRTTLPEATPYVPPPPPVLVYQATSSSEMPWLTHKMTESTIEVTVLSGRFLAKRLTCTEQLDSLSLEMRFGAALHTALGGKLTSAMRCRSEAQACSHQHLGTCVQKRARTHPPHAAISVGSANADAAASDETATGKQRWKYCRRQNTPRLSLSPFTIPAVLQCGGCPEWLRWPVGGGRVTTLPTPLETLLGMTTSFRAQSSIGVRSA